MNFIWKLFKALIGLLLCSIAGIIVAIGVLIMICCLGQMAIMFWAEAKEMTIVLLITSVGFIFMFWLFDTGVEWGFNSIKKLFKCYK